MTKIVEKFKIVLRSLGALIFKKGFNSINIKALIKQMHKSCKLELWTDLYQKAKIQVMFSTNQLPNSQPATCSFTIQIFFFLTDKN